MISRSISRQSPDFVLTRSGAQLSQLPIHTATRYVQALREGGSLPAGVAARVVRCFRGQPRSYAPQSESHGVEAGAVPDRSRLRALCTA